MIEWNSWKFKIIVVFIIASVFLKFNQLVNMEDRRIVEKYINEKYKDKIMYIKDESPHRKGEMYFIESKENKDNSFIIILNDKKAKGDTYEEDVERGMNNIYKLKNEVYEILGKEFKKDINNIIQGRDF